MFKRFSCCSDQISEWGKNLIILLRNDCWCKTGCLSILKLLMAQNVHAQQSLQKKNTKQHLVSGLYVGGNVLSMTAVRDRMARQVGNWQEGLKKPHLIPVVCVRASSGRCLWSNGVGNIFLATCNAFWASFKVCRSIPCAPRPPDRHPIEHLWDVVEWVIRSVIVQPTDLRQLRDTIMSTWSLWGMFPAPRPIQATKKCLSNEVGTRYACI